MKIENVRRGAPLVLAAVAMTFLSGAAMADVRPTAVKTEPTDTAPDCQPSGLLDVLRGVCSSSADDETTGSVAKEEAPATATETRASGLRALIHKHAAAHGIPADLAEAVVHVESSFNPKARGAAGEIGLMQIKPATARGIGYRGSAKGLYDVETNLHWGMVYLAGAYKLAGGDTCGAILRYNGGHAARKMTRGVRAYCSKVNRYVASL